MAQILCNKSGILFECQFLPLSLQSGELAHPFFALSQKRLLNLIPKWAAGAFTIEQSYLFYLSLLNSTSLIEWRSEAEFTARTPAIVSANMEALAQIIGKINLINHPSFNLPKFVVTRDTRTLDNSSHWIAIWLDNYNDWNQAQRDTKAQAEFRARVEMREEALDKLIRRAYASNPAKTSSALADWASVVGEFPSSTTEHPITHRQVPLDEYWKQIIRAAHDEDKLWRFPRADIVELQEHCHTNIVNAGVRGHTLFQLLSNGLKNYDTYAGLANFEVSRGSTSFRILSESESRYEATVATLVETAPTAEPKRESFATQFAYIKAKMQWQLSQARASAQPK